MIGSLPLFEEIIEPSMKEVKQFLSTIYPKAFKEFWTTDPAIAKQAYGTFVRVPETHDFLKFVQTLTKIAQKRPSLAHFGQRRKDISIYQFAFLNEIDRLKFNNDIEKIAFDRMQFQVSDYPLNHFDVMELYKRNKKLFDKTDSQLIDTLGNLFEETQPIF